MEADAPVPMRLVLAATLLGAGTPALVRLAARAVVGPARVPMLAVAIGALGISTAAASQPGVGWSISSICFSLIAIILIVMVIREMLRR